MRLGRDRWLQRKLYVLTAAMACRRPRVVKIQVGAIGWRCCVTGETFVMGSLRASFMGDLIALKFRLMRRSNSLQRRVKKIGLEESARKTCSWCREVNRAVLGGYHILRT